jgi:hypothetical protein
MPRQIEAQQQYIDRLQDELNSAKEDRRFITHHWPDAHAEGKYEGMTLIGYEVTLKYSGGRVWGSGQDEHLAWKNAREALEDEGVLLAFQKMDKPDGE